MKVQSVIRLSLPFPVIHIASSGFVSRSALSEVVEYGVSNFVGKYGQAINAGRPLPAEAAMELDQLAKDSRLLKKTVSRTIMVFR